MTGVRRKRKRKEDRKTIIEKRKRNQQREKETNRFVFETTGKPVRQNPKN